MVRTKPHPAYRPFSLALPLVIQRDLVHGRADQKFLAVWLAAELETYPMCFWLRAAHYSSRPFPLSLFCFRGVEAEQNATGQVRLPRGGKTQKKKREGATA